MRPVRHPLLLALAAACATNACVAFHGPKHSAAPYPQLAQKIPIRFTSMAVTRSRDGSEQPSTAVAIVEGYRLQESGFFTTTQSLPAAATLTLECKTVLPAASWGARFGRALYLGVSAVSGGLLPFSEEVPRTLEVQVWQGEKLLTRYRFASFYRRIGSLFLAPFWGWTTGNTRWGGEEAVRTATDASLTRELLLALQSDFLPAARRRRGDAAAPATP